MSFCWKNVRFSKRTIYLPTWHTQTPFTFISTRHINSIFAFITHPQFSIKSCNCFTISLSLKMKPWIDQCEHERHSYWFKIFMQPAESSPYCGMCNGRSDLNLESKAAASAVRYLLVEGMISWRDDTWVCIVMHPQYVLQSHSVKIKMFSCILQEQSSVAVECATCR